MKTPALLALTLLAAMPAYVHADRPVALGQTARVAAMRVVPLDLVEDSRCPMNARCIWAGRAVVKVALKIGRASCRERV